MDGNGRWAQQRKLPRSAGHKAGVEQVRSTIKTAIQNNISALTLFAFSTENWQRPKTEVSLLLKLFVTALRKEIKELAANGVKVKFIGDLSQFPDNLQTEIVDAEELTKECDKLTLTIAANYGGKWDIVNACQSLSQQVADGELQPKQIDDELFAKQLTLAELPPVDLLIRTGGEQRISNFLLWQAAYAELYFVDCFWPEFDVSEFEAALNDYTNRQRRFGKVP